MRSRRKQTSEPVPDQWNPPPFPLLTLADWELKRIGGDQAGAILEERAQERARIGGIDIQARLERHHHDTFPETGKRVQDA